ncbi:MAG: hypothetical protein WCF98_00110 [Synechococcus sp. ELA057]|jgi:hypothetical protein
MPSPEPDSLGANTDWIRLIAAAADLCRKPLRHGVVLVSEEGDSCGGWDPQRGEITLRLEARDAEGQRCPDEDLELEIYPSGSDLNLTLAWCLDEGRPMLWQGSHPVWMDAAGSRCGAPAEGVAIEALGRRLRSLLVAGSGALQA